MTVVLIYGFVAAGFALSLWKDPRRTLMALSVGQRALLKMLPSLTVVVGLVGLLAAVVPPELIGRYLGQGSGPWGTMAAAMLGAVMLLPSLVSFPLAAALLRSGATLMTIAAFITTLTMVGVVTASLEVKELGRRFTVIRNGLSFVFALLIAALMGVILS
ncbi:MAG: permease [Bacillota bacterium]